MTQGAAESEQLLRPARPDEVKAVIQVSIQKTLLSWANMASQGLLGATCLRYNPQHPNSG